MDMFVVDALLHVCVPWVLLTYALLFLGKQLSKYYEAIPTLWWCLLMASVVPFMPISLWSATIVLPDLALFNDFEAGQEAIISSLNTATPLANTWLISVLAVAYLSITSLKIFRFVRVWQKLNDWVHASKSVTHASVAKVAIVKSLTEHSPFVFGVLSPTIVLPRSFETLTEAQQRIVLQHELSHIAARDHISLVIWRLIDCLLWFNPAISKMEYHFIRAMEKRCDTETISRCDIHKQTYAETLLDALRKCTLARQTAAADFVTQFNTSALSAKDYRERILNIMQPKHAPKMLLKFGLMALFATMLLLASVINNTSNATQHTWRMPLENYAISAPFRQVSFVRQYRPHQGIDLVAPMGSPITAVASGVVTIADDNTLPKGYGKVVLIQHDNGYQTLYAHLKDIQVEAGQGVSPQQVIGTLGDTGNVTGPHLHLEVLKDKRRIDPISMLDIPM